MNRYITIICILATCKPKEFIRFGLCKLFGLIRDTVALANIAAVYGQKTHMRKCLIYEQICLQVASDCMV